MQNNIVDIHKFFNEFRELIANQFSKSKEINIVISGGESVKKVFEYILLNYDLQNKLNFILSDERMLPFGHNDRNDTYYFQKLLLSNKHVFNFYPLLNQLNEIMEFNYINIETIHFAILGVGEDGHIAGIFPNINYTPLTKSIIYTSESPKYPPCRVSYNYEFLKRCLKRIIIINNTIKKTFVQENIKNQNLPFIIFFPNNYLILND
jgi:6-phosphogluconolactonase